MSGTRRKFSRGSKIFVAYVCVPIAVSTLSILVLGSLHLAIEMLPKSWGIESPGILPFVAWGALISAPVAWVVGPLTFGLDFDFDSPALLWRQVGIGACAGACVGGFSGLLFLGGADPDSPGLVSLALSLVVLGILFGVVHALSLRYGLLWLGLAQIVPKLKT